MILGVFMKNKSRRQKRIEAYMMMSRFLTMREAKTNASFEHLIYLKNLLNGLINEYGEEEGNLIFSLMLRESSEYWQLLNNNLDKTGILKIKR